MTTPKISFLATGNEIIEGDIQDTNGGYFARTVYELGASIYQHMAASDTMEEIIAALAYLLKHSDAVIVVGGMGPTSDDRTRFAVSEFTGKELIFDENSWESIQERFKRFHLNLVPSNRQQALFPEGATVYPNEHGSAPGCYVPWQNKHIFMLPGPPKECRPIFDAQIIPLLQAQSFFNKKETFRWLTLGYSESEIAEQIDAIAKPHGFDTGFRWAYPYLEIKLIAQDKQPNLAVVEQVHALLQSHCVSRNRQDAVETLTELLSSFGKLIYVANNMTEALASPFPQHQQLIDADNQNASDKEIFFSVDAYPRIIPGKMDAQTITFSSKGFINQQQKHEHQLTIPCRGPEVFLAAQAYAAWQLSVFLRELKSTARF